MLRRRSAPFLAPLLVTLALASAWPAAPASAQTTAGTSAARAYVLVDADSGVVLTALNHEEPLLIASLAKVMTAFVALEQLQPSYEIEVSELAASKPAMRIGMKAGQLWRLEDALRSLLMVSANDAAYAIAEAAGGTVEEFSRLMQRTAERLGMKHSQWFDPAGLDGEEGVGGGTKASAYDLAIVARNALEVPEIAEAVRLPTYEFVGGDVLQHTLRNHNRMLTTFPGATGMKTGYTKAAGHTLIATAERDGRRLIAVVLNSPSVYEVAGTLLNEGFNTPRDAEGQVLPPTSFTRAEAPSVEPEQAAREPVAAGASGGGLLTSLRRLGAVSLVALLVAFFARREQIKRRKRRRTMMRRAYLDAKRRGMIDVIDAERYYGATRRKGHVQVMRPEDDLWPPREWQDHRPRRERVHEREREHERESSAYRG